MKKSWFSGKNVIVTGATSGIGREIVKILLKEYDCRIVGVSRNIEKAENFYLEVSAWNKNYNKFCFDVGDKEAWSNFLRHLNEINFLPDLIINNAGVLPKFCCASKTEIEEFEKIIQVDFFSAIYSFKTFYNQTNPPSFVNVSSSAALATLAGTGAYSSAKAALRSFTESLSYELKGTSYVGLVCPGFTRTDIFKNQNQSIDEGLIGKVSMPAVKMAKKIVGGIRRKKRRMVFGKDAHLMSFLCRLMPKRSTDIMSFVLKKSKMKLFEEVFSE